VDLAKRLSIGRSEPLRIVPLSEIVSWERGGLPTLAAENASTALPRIIRLTIDLDGLKKIERLSEVPPFGRERYDDRVFVLRRRTTLATRLRVSRWVTTNCYLYLAVFPTPSRLSLAPWGPAIESASSSNFLQNGLSQLVVNRSTEFDV
jgi:hypothetical protein